MHWAHSGIAAGEEYLPLIAITCKHRFMSEMSSAVAQLSSYLPVGLWPSFCSALFLCKAVPENFAHQISSFARLPCRKRISASAPAS
jgi:hypothetical protein